LPCCGDLGKREEQRIDPQGLRVNEPRLEIVFAFRSYSGQPGQAGTWTESKYKTTRQAIEALGGQIVDESREEIAANELDAGGRYMPRPKST
jgi:hypothetical protein